MRLKIILILFFTFFLTNANSKCLDPVDGEYIIVTDDPDQVLQNINPTHQKINLNSAIIYDHRTLIAFSRSQKSKTLSESTLVLNLSSQEFAKVSQLKNTSVISNCFVELDDSLLSYAENSKSVQSSIYSPELNENFNDSRVMSFNDSLYNLQWGFKSVDSNSEVSDFSSPTLIAISDTGFDIHHEDLKDNLWVNQLELGGISGVDDDKNGCIDDFNGCDVADKDGDIGINNYKSNLVDHGTHVAGIIGATRNNTLGIAGAAQNPKLMLIKAFSSRRKTTASDLIKSIYYAVNNGAKIINCSWGTGSEPTLAEFNAFEYARLNNVIAVTAAGNGGTYASRTSPAGLSNVLTVGSYNSIYQLSTFSNFGDAVDVLAPGGDGFERRNDFIMSLTIQSNYIEKKGTSMAAPFISSILGNLKSAFPTLTRNELINILLLSSEKKAVQAYFDPKYKDQLNFVNQTKALNLANEYLKNSLDSRELNFEPKTIEKPTTQLGLNSPYQQGSLSSSSSSGSGCSNSNLQNKANSSKSILFLIIPFIFLLVIRQKNKKGL